MTFNQSADACRAAVIATTSEFTECFVYSRARGLPVAVELSMFALSEDSTML